jgi:hypothetical protein
MGSMEVQKYLSNSQFGTSGVAKMNRRRLNPSWQEPSIMGSQLSLGPYLRDVWMDIRLGLLSPKNIVQNIL